MQQLHLPQVHFGFEVLLSAANDEPGRPPLRVGEFLATFELAMSESAGAAAGAVVAGRAGAGALVAPSFVQRFTGGECREGSHLRGGYHSQATRLHGEGRARERCSRQGMARPT